MTDSDVDSKAEVKQATKYVKETENVAEKYSAMTVSKNSSDVNMNVGEMPSAAFTAVPTLKSVKKVRGAWRGDGASRCGGIALRRRSWRAPGRYTHRAGVRHAFTERFMLPRATMERMNIHTYIIIIIIIHMPL